MGSTHLWTTLANMQESMRTNIVRGRLLRADRCQLTYVIDKARLENMDQAQQTIDRPPPSYVNAITEAAKDSKVDFISSKIKSNVRQTMEGMSQWIYDCVWIAY